MPTEMEIDEDVPSNRKRSYDETTAAQTTERNNDEVRNNHDRSNKDDDDDKKKGQTATEGIDEDDDIDDDDNNDDDGKEYYKQLRAYGEHKRAVSSVKVAPHRLCKNRDDGGISALVASASADGTCKIWDLKNATTTTTSNSSTIRRPMLPINTCVGHSRGINEVSWNPVSPLLATASDDKTVRLWDAVTADALVELRGHDNFVFCVDQYNSTIVTGSFDESVKLWDIRSGECVSTLPAHSDPVTAVSFNRDGTTVCSASHDGLIRIWDVATGECLKTIYAAGNPPVSSVKFAPNSKYILAGTLDSTLRLWPVTVSGKNCCTKTYRCKQFVNSKYSIVTDFTYNGNIIVGSETGDVILFNLNNCTVQQLLQGHTDAVLAVSAHDTLPILSTGAMTTDRRIEFWVAGKICTNYYSTINNSNKKQSLKQQQQSQLLKQQQQQKELLTTSTDNSSSKKKKSTTVLSK